MHMLVAIIVIAELSGFLSVSIWMLVQNPERLKQIATVFRRPQPGEASSGVQASERERAELFLCRVAALTGAKRRGNHYVLDVGHAEFHVGDRHVGRIPIGKDSPIPRGQTCFYPSNQEMPAAEKIATALLHLKNNPALFDGWALQSGSFKSDGTLFTEARPRVFWD
jgi:hypothetical protein